MSARRSFDAALAALREVAVRFDAASHDARRAALARLRALPLPRDAALAAYHDSLLFVRAHPADAREAHAVDRELARVAAFLRAGHARQPESWDAVGLPHVTATARYSHDCVRWLSDHPHVRVSLDSFGEGSLTLNETLRATLPAIERPETGAGLDNLALMRALGVRDDRRLAFLVDQFARLDAQPALKDMLFEALAPYVRIVPRHRLFSRAFNRLTVASLHCHRELVRRVDARAELDRALPAAVNLDGPGRARAVRVLKNTMLLSGRETDPATYLDEASLRIFALERGIAVAIFGMTPERQLPIEVYVGFTLFKNGLPAAYGGAWVFGRRARFGLNVFEPYRGGESSVMMCQILRVYRQVFSVDCFEVEPYMYGLDNPEGIASGAFWYYHRHGFRPVDRGLRALAEREARRIAERPGYRSSRATLVRFTAGNCELNLGARRPPDLTRLLARVTPMIARRFGGDRGRALAQCLADLSARLDQPVPDEPSARAVWLDWALLSAAVRPVTPGQAALMRRVLHTRPADAFAYQHALTEWLDAFDADQPA